MGLNRRPIVDNKYNLTISKIKKLKVGDRSKISTFPFWRNDVIHAWCLTDFVGSLEDEKYGTDLEYWIGIYDIDAPRYKGKFKFNLSAYGGMCNYDFEKFYKSEDIDSELDLQIQEKFLNIINSLIDSGVLVLI